MRYWLPAEVHCFCLLCLLAGVWALRNRGVSIRILFLACGLVALVPTAEAWAGSSSSSPHIGFALVDGDWNLAETDVALPVDVNLLDDTYVGVPLTLHAACGTPSGAEGYTWAGDSLTQSAAGVYAAGTPGCTAHGDRWLLRVWVVRDDTHDTVITWTSDLELYPVGAGCPSTAAPGLPCVTAVNEEDPSVSTGDVSTVVSSIQDAQASVVAGFALVLFVGAILLILAIRRHRRG